MEQGQVRSGINSTHRDHGHGGNIYKAGQELGMSESDLIDFSASINPLGLPETVKKAIQEGMKNLIHYPDPDSTELRRTLAAHLCLEPENIICGNGSTELIYLLPRALRPKKVLIPSPTFSEYERACLLIDELGITNYELKEEDNFRIVPEGFIAAMKGHDMAFLCNPNNPTGHLLSREDVRSIAEAAHQHQCVLVLDEAFIDFMADETLIDHVKDNPYLIVLRSMTKFYAITGLRAGYAAMHEKVWEEIIKYKEPWTVNSLAQMSAIAALGDKDYREATMELIKNEKAFLENGFQQMGLTFFPSAANYYLLSFDGATEAAMNMRKKGLLVRDCSNFHGLDGRHIRVAVRSRKENEKLLELISELWKR